MLTIPDDMGNLYDYPAAALTEIRRVMSQDLDFYLDGPSKVSLFLYDSRIPTWRSAISPLNPL